MNPGSKGARTGCGMIGGRMRTLFRGPGAYQHLILLDTADEDRTLSESVHEGCFTGQRISKKQHHVLNAENTCDPPQRLDMIGFAGESPILRQRRSFKKTTHQVTGVWLHEHAPIALINSIIFPGSSGPRDVPPKSWALRCWTRRDNYRYRKSHVRS